VIVITRAIRGAEVDFSNFKVHTRHPVCDTSVHVITFSEREEESGKSKNMYSPRSPSPLIDTDKCCLPPPPRNPRACLSDPPPPVAPERVLACLSRV